MTGMETQFFILGHLILIVLSGIFAVISLRSDGDYEFYKENIRWYFVGVLVFVEGIYWFLHFVLLSDQDILNWLV